MKRIAIATIIDFSNYGNRLQHYALQQFLVEQGGFTVESINSRQGTHLGGSRVSELITFALNNGGRATTTNLLRRILGRSGEQPESPMSRNLRRFTEQRITLNPITYSSKNQAQLELLSYDAFLVGSDQVWNPIFGLGRGLGFLEFAPPGTRYSYAASFGVSRVPRNLIARYRSGLRGLDYISVREASALPLVEQLSGRKAQQHVDPVMLFGAEWWRGLGAACGPWPAQQYVALIMLDGDHREQYKGSSFRKSLRGIEHLDLLHMARNTERSFSAEEYVAAISGSTLVVTDSFHACVFAAIMEIPVALYMRPGMASRLDSLISLVGRPPQPPPRGEPMSVEFNSTSTKRLDCLRDASKDSLLGWLREK